MNKVILAVALVAVGLTGFNTHLLLQITGAIQNAGKEIAPVAKQLEKLQPVLQKLSEQQGALPGGNLPELPKDKKSDEGDGPFNPKGKPPLPPGVLPKG